MTQHTQTERSVARCTCARCTASRRLLSAIGAPILADSASVLQGYRERMWPESVREAQADMRRTG
jgi:hypothetical protein